MPTFHECYTKALLDSGITVNITAPDVIKALRQHCLDTKNTRTNEYPTIDAEVEKILRHFLNRLWRDTGPSV